MESVLLVGLALVFKSGYQLIKLKKTSNKKAFEDLKVALQEQTEKLVLQNRFAAVSAHEIRNFATKYSVLKNTIV